MTIRTLSDLVFRVRDVSAGRADLLSTRHDRRREALSTTDFLAAVHALALVLEREGVKKGDRVALFSENRPEWHVVDFACQLLGAPSVPLYPSLPAGQVAYILRNSGARWVFFSDAAKRELLAEVRGAMTAPPRLVAFDPEAGGSGVEVLTRLQGEVAEERGRIPLERFRGRVEESDLASIIYTSGTTGEPKGVMLTHRNLVSNCLAAGRRFAIGPRDLALSFLPLSHVYQRTVDHLCFHQGVAICYLESIERVAKALAQVQPTVVTSVPRLFERAYFKVLQNAAKETGFKRWLFRWAVEVGKRHAVGRREGFVGPFLALGRLAADALVYRRVRQPFGGRLRLAISGGAPLSLEVAELFEAVGLPLYQGYGLTETAPVVATNAPGDMRQGSVGRALPGVEVRIADDGEILVRGPNVMAGYWEAPEATAEILDGDGWLHTGDVGRLDRAGYLYITDRKKDILITSGGKNVAPQPIEGRLASDPAVLRAVVVGDGYPYLSALLVPDREHLAAQLGPLPDDLAADDRVRARLDAVVDSVNAGLAEHERIRRWAVLPRDLTVEAGELTPTLKVKRKVVAQRYAEAIAGMYLKSQQLA